MRQQALACQPGRGDFSGSFLSWAQGELHVEEKLQPHEKQAKGLFLALPCCTADGTEPGEPGEHGGLQRIFQSQIDTSERRKMSLSFFKSSPRDRRKAGDVLFPCWLLLEKCLFLVLGPLGRISGFLWWNTIQFFPSVYCLTLVHQAVHVCQFMSQFCFQLLECFVFHV